MRGAISVAFLERIEAIFAEHQRKLLADYIAAKERAGVADENLAAARKTSLPAPFRLADWFDLVGGTSTGALIAGAVALGFNTANIKKFYIDRAPFIFQRAVLAHPRAAGEVRRPRACSRRSTRSSRSARSTATTSSPASPW